MPEAGEIESTGKKVRSYLKVIRAGTPERLDGDEASFETASGYGK